MADPFTPKFVDLVKNNCATTGTGDFTLGTAATGFRSFTSALLVGDRFYYACLGVDKPAEREIGRGTLLSGGKIAREPIGGAAKTSFTAGNKTIALVAAGEWYDGVAGSMAAATSAAQAANAAAAAATSGLATVQGDINAIEAEIGGLEVQVASLDSELDGTSQDVAALSAQVAALGGGGGGAATSVATRSALAGTPSALGAIILRESGREGVFVWDSSDLSTLVAADTAQGLYVPPANDTDGSSGAWVRKFDGPLQAHWFGMSPTSTAAANDSAIQTALSLADALQVSGAGYGPGSIGIHIRAGFYNLSQTIALENPLRLTGDYTALVSGGGTVLKFNADVDGISTTGSTGAYYIDGLCLVGPQAGTIGTKHGLKIRGCTLAQNLFIDGFSGNGIDCYGNFAGDGSNVSGSKFRDIWIQSVNHGSFSDGADANNIIYDNVCVTNARLVGHYDSSFLGCVYRGGMIHACGHDTDYPSVCTFNGHRYMVAPGQESWCSTNAPTGAATSNQGWLWFSDTDRGVATVAWTSGLTWHFSAPFAMDPTNHNAYSIFDGMYVEPDQNAPICTWPAVRVSPAHCIQGALHPDGREFYYDTANSAGKYHGGDKAVGGQLSAQSILARHTLYADGATKAVIVGGEAGGPARNAILDLHTYGGSYYGIAFKMNGAQHYSFTNNGSRFWFYANNSGAGSTGWSWQWQSGGTGMELLESGLDLKIGAFKINGAEVLSNAGRLQAIGMPALTGDVTTAGGSLATLIANDAVTYSKMQDVTATDRLLGRASAGSGDIEEIVCTAAGRALLDDTDALAQRATLGLAAVAASGSGADLGAASITFGKVQNVAAAKLVGNATGSAGPLTEIGLASGLTFSGSDLGLGAITPSSVAASGALTSSSGKIGYAAGAGGTIAQATSKSTGVTLNKQCGEITLNGAALAANSAVTFTLTNSTIEAGDRLLINHKSGGTFGAYVCDARAAAGSASVMLRNVTAGSLSEAVVLGFAVIKAVTA